MLPVFLTQSLMNTAPFWVAMLGYLVNNEVIRWQLLACMVGCFAGIMVLNFGSNSNKTVDFNNSEQYKQYYTFGVLGCVLMVFLSALQQVLTRKIREVHFSIMQANYAFFACITMVIVLSIENGLKQKSAGASFSLSTFTSLRLFNYSWQQWLCLILLSAVNYPL